MNLLHLLPREHPLRNRPLKEVGGKIRFHGQTNWRPIEKYKIGNNSYNELGMMWTKYHDFHAEEAPVNFVQQSNRDRAE